MDPHTSPHGLPSPQPSPRSLSPVAEIITSADSLHPQRANDSSNVSKKSQTPPSVQRSLDTAKATTAHQRQRSSSLPTRDLDPNFFADGSTLEQTIHLTPAHPEAASRPEVLKMSPSQIFNFASRPDSLPVRPMTPDTDEVHLADGEGNEELRNGHEWPSRSTSSGREPKPRFKSQQSAAQRRGSSSLNQDVSTPLPYEARPQNLSRSLSIPIEAKSKKGTPNADHESRASPMPTANARRRVTSVRGQPKDRTPSSRAEHLHDSFGSSIPLPPFSLPTYLQLELSSQRPSPLYIHRPNATDIPYESSRVKFERLQNFLLVPPYLENILLFGALTCLDSWLYTFTLMPLRFFKSLWLLAQWAVVSTSREIDEMIRFISSGLPRVWQRRRRKSSIVSPPRRLSISAGNNPPRVDASLDGIAGDDSEPLSTRFIERVRRHRRKKSVPSDLQQNHKADLLSGLLVILCCIILSQFDASRMYHNIRGQAAIKLYVIYNVLEVCDRLFSALGQDIMECLFSNETLERKANGRSKLLQPLWMFGLALVYTVVHATALFYQVITLNVAVNSYSNALLTLLMSNQFVEIKGTVFKKFEKENLFQLTCADVVERFQLWLMLLIIALRNIVEVGGISITSSNDILTNPSSSSNPPPPAPNATNPVSSTFGILPYAFQTLPSLFPFQVLSPFLVVLGSEMIVDWLKHAYITKFNATSPRIYARFLDILAKDYYTHAFVDQSLMKRIGLPVIPLACLFIRATLQTYHMFLATNISPPSISTATSLASAHDEAEPTSSPILAQIDIIFRRALGRSSLGGGARSAGVMSWTLDDAIALATMLLFFLALYLLLLALKLALGMILLGVARNRYAKMLEREIKGEKEKLTESENKRLGGWGVAELGEDRRKVIYESHEGELRKLKEKETRFKEKEEKESLSGRGLKAMEGVERYAMVAKRIW